MSRSIHLWAITIMDHRSIQLIHTNRASLEVSLSCFRWVRNLQLHYQFMGLWCHPALWVPKIHCSLHITWLGRERMKWQSERKKEPMQSTGSADLIHFPCYAKELCALSTLCTALFFYHSATSLCCVKHWRCAFSSVKCVKTDLIRVTYEWSKEPMNTHETKWHPIQIPNSYLAFVRAKTVEIKKPSYN